MNLENCDYLRDFRAINRDELRTEIDERDDIFSTNSNSAKIEFFVKILDFSQKILDFSINHNLTPMRTNRTRNQMKLRKQLSNDKRNSFSH